MWAGRQEQPGKGAGSTNNRVLKAAADVSFIIFGPF